MENIGIVIQARMNSSRLPGKVLMKFCGKPMILFQVDLLRQYNIQSEIVIATTLNPLDDEIEKLCQECDIHCVRGSEENVFQRLCLVTKCFKFDHIIRLTGDNPLTNYRILRACLEEHEKWRSDLTSTRRILPDRAIKRYTTKGNSIDVINCETLLSIDGDSLDDFEMEHVIPVFFKGGYRVSYVKDDRPSQISLSVDNISDFERVHCYARKVLEDDTLFQELGFFTINSLIGGEIKR